MSALAEEAGAPLEDLNDDNVDDDGEDNDDDDNNDDAGAAQVTLSTAHRDPEEVLAEMKTRPLSLMEQMTNQFAQSGKLPPVTPRFLACAKGDGAEAERRWRATLEWRVSENMNAILREPQPQFDTIKRFYPTFYHGKSKAGYQVYYELPGRVDLKKLHAAGVTFETLLRFYLFSGEYLQAILTAAAGDDAKSINVFDCSGLLVRKGVPKDVRRFMSTANKLMGDHYPERAFKVLVINAPTSFSVLWRMVSGFIDPVTRAKVSVVHGKKASLKALATHIPMDQIPPRYGGTSPFDLGKSPEETMLADIIHANNSTS